MSRFAQVSAIALTMAALISCSGGSNAPQSILPAPDESTSARSLPVPEGVSAADWESIIAAFENTPPRVSSSLPGSFITPDLEFPAGIISWDYFMPGDYDYNGEVSISDLSVIGRWFGSRSEDSNWALASAADGNGDGIISIADVTPIGHFFRERCTFFMIERESLAGENLWEEADRVQLSSLVSTAPAGERPRFEIEMDLDPTSTYRIYCAGPDTLVPPLNVSVEQAQLENDLNVRWELAQNAETYRVYRMGNGETPFDVGEANSWNDPSPLSFDSTRYWAQSVNGEERSSLSKPASGYNYVRSIPFQGSLTGIDPAVPRSAVGTEAGLFIFHVNEDGGLSVSSTTDSEPNHETAWARSIVRQNGQVLQIIGAVELSGRPTVAYVHAENGVAGDCSLELATANTDSPAGPDDWDITMATELSDTPEGAVIHGDIDAWEKGVQLVLSIRDSKMFYVRSTKEQFAMPQDFVCYNLGRVGDGMDIEVLDDRVAISYYGPRFGEAWNEERYDGMYIEARNLEPQPLDWQYYSVSRNNNLDLVGTQEGNRAGLLQHNGSIFTTHLGDSGSLLFSRLYDKPDDQGISWPTVYLGLFPDWGSPVWMEDIGGYPVILYQSNGGLVLAWLNSEFSSTSKEWNLGYMDSTEHQPMPGSSTAAAQLTQYQGRPLAVYYDNAAEGVIALMPLNWPDTGYLRP